MFQKIIIVLLMSTLVAAAAHASAVTLSQSALMSLDYDHSSEALTAQVIEKRLSGNGVEFDIYFQGNGGADSQMFFGSSVFGGAGSLVFADFSAYDAFQMDVALLKVGGYDNPQAESFELWFSPMVYDSISYKFFNAELLSTAVGNNTATASMDIGLLSAGNRVHGDWIFEIGYEIHMDDPTAWPTEGVILSLLISPTEGADQIIPEPISLSFLIMGGLCLIAVRRK
ncbi:MAG: hypothetical protein JXB18_05090 [Sedimentisphaerales bacterium]|nr:hypothetical protein [Sedimentisphaerales bacterium]